MHCTLRTHTHTHTHTHTQEKSRLDWMSYKRDEGLEEELSQHKKDGYALLHIENLTGGPGQWGTCIKPNSEALSY